MRRRRRLSLSACRHHVHTNDDAPPALNRAVRCHRPPADSSLSSRSDTAEDFISLSPPPYAAVTA